MAPETARVGYSDARSDIYALGIMFYEMMTGTVPFTGETPVEVMMKQVNERVPPMHKLAPDAEVTPDAERMILKALAKDPELRHQSMEEFHRDLQKCYGQLRFRRTVKTPTINTPTAVTIPLTKKKKAGSPGAVPSVIAGSGSSVEFEITPTRPRAPTPRLPGLPLNASAPILLTRKKSPRPDSGVPERTNMGMGTPASAQSVATFVDEPWVRRVESTIDRPSAHSPDLAKTTSEAASGQPADTSNWPSNGVSGAPIDPGAAGAVGAARPSDAQRPGESVVQPAKKKRTTLPLGLDQNADRATPPATLVVSRTPVPEGEDAGIAPVMIALATRSKDREQPPVPAMPDRVTPRVSMAAGGEVDERSWLDEPTTPAVAGYPEQPGKAGKTG
jgi:serine/threonine protein kinase